MNPPPSPIDLSSYNMVIPYISGKINPEINSKVESIIEYIFMLYMKMYFQNVLQLDVKQQFEMFLQKLNQEQRARVPFDKNQKMLMML